MNYEEKMKWTVIGLPEGGQIAEAERMPKQEKQALRQQLRKRHYCDGLPEASVIVKGMIPEQYNPYTIAASNANVYFSGGVVRIRIGHTRKGLYFTATI